VIDTTTEMIGRLLAGSVAALDIPPELRAAAHREYERVGNWLADYADGEAGWIVYPQGSFLLNTVVLPRGADEYDVDCVCRRELRVEQTTKQQLKDEVGAALAGYRRAHEHLADGPAALKSRTRCWTLAYPRSMRFHLDVLPAIPNLDAAPTGILITDRNFHEWLRSNPLAYAEWFKAQAQTEFIAKRARLAEAERVQPQAIPEWQVRTILQRTVQVLKLHRNEFFSEDPDSRPASILITTLAAHAYRGEPDLYEAVLGAVERMPAYIQPGPVVANPVEPRENFADRWQRKPQLEVGFREWLAALAEDLQGAEATRGGLDSVVARLSESFGSAPVAKAAGDLADEYRRGRETGALSFGTATGLLSSSGEIPVRNHDFYGEIG
jgi:hypothetical protein